LKGVLSRRAKQAHPQAFTTVTDGKVWSDGYFCRSVGRARRSVIEGYVAGQWEHHGYTAEVLRAMRYRFEDSSPEGPVEICYHVALQTQRRARLFAPDITDGLVAHLRGILRAQERALRAATFLPDHAHFSVRAPAKVAPANLARGVLAEGWRWMTEHHPGALKLDEACDVWSPSAYVGTMGEVTTAHVSNYLGIPE
jgi:REP element-mobilizing transposase RayT